MRDIIEAAKEVGAQLSYACRYASHESCPCEESGSSECVEQVIYAAHRITVPQLNKLADIIRRDAIPEGYALVPTWQPIETAPEGQLVVCMWINADGEPCHSFDYFEEGVWQNYFNEHEHYLIAGAANGRSEDAPYTHFMPMPAMVAAAQGGK